MILWRIARAPHADLTGEGARLYGGRWNRPGRAVVYLSEHPALALLEILVHLDLPRELLPDDYLLLRVEAPDGPAAAPARPGDGEETDIGDDWLAARETLLLPVPSVLVPHAVNWLMNPAHGSAADARILERIPIRFDERLAR